MELVSLLEKNQDGLSQEVKGKIHMEGVWERPGTSPVKAGPMRHLMSYSHVEEIRPMTSPVRSRRIPRNFTRNGKEKGRRQKKKQQTNHLIVVCLVSKVPKRKLVPKVVLLILNTTLNEILYAYCMNYVPGTGICCG